MNLAQLRQRTLERLDEDPTNPATWTMDEVTAALNEGLQLLVAMTLCLETQATLILPGTAFWNVLSQFPDYLVPLRMRFAGTKVRPARLADLDALDPSWTGGTGTVLQRYGSEGFSLLFGYPVVTGSAEFTYANAPAVLLLDTDTPAIPDYTHPALEDYAQYQLREKQGGSEFAAGLGHLAAFLDVAKQLNGQVRARSLGQRYDKVPVELERLDLSRLLKIRKELLPGTVKNVD